MDKLKVTYVCEDEVYNPNKFYAKKDLNIVRSKIPLRTFMESSYVIFLKDDGQAEVIKSRRSGTKIRKIVYEVTGYILYLKEMAMYLGLNVDSKNIFKEKFEREVLKLELIENNVVDLPSIKFDVYTNQNFEFEF